jgi:hypothetical protein
LRGFEKFVAQEKYQDWLFLFGTIIVAEGPLPRDYVSDEWQQGDYLLYNFAPVYKGYDPKVSTRECTIIFTPKFERTSAKLLLATLRSPTTMANDIWSPSDSLVSVSVLQLI